MSAIAGLWRFDGKPDLAPACGRMLNAQQIYGPHGSRQWNDSQIAMGRRLFRTLPEDVFDRQPLLSSDGTLVLVADVRLSNREELVATLGWPSGARARSSDAAILLASLDRWGEAALDRLEGDFAFALWNTRAQTLTLARDFLGQRPLHYHQTRNLFAFSSMAKGLHALPDIPYAPDEHAMAEFVVLMPQTGTRSYFKDIGRVEAGHVLTVSRNGVTTRRYWNPQRKRIVFASSRDYAEALRHHLDQATRSCLRGIGGTVATHLSSGFDSSAVTATAARLLAPEDVKVMAFTAVPHEGYDLPAPPGRIGDEGPLAAEVAALYPNIEHVKIRSGHLSPLDELDRTFFLLERPVMNICNWVWARAINRAAQARGVRVLLTGQVGNMSLSYAGFERLPELLRQGLWFRLAREMAKLARSGERSWPGILAGTFGPFLPAGVWKVAQRLFRRSSHDIVHYTAVRREALAALDLRKLAKERGLDFAYRPWKDGFAMRLWVLRRFDLGNYNKGVLAGWGIDQRDPTADKRLVEFCLNVPNGEYLRNGRSRALAKAALADRLPQAVLKERRKGLQAIDWHEGLTAARNEVTAEVSRIGASASAATLLDTVRMGRLADNWPVSGWERDDIREAYRMALLRGISAGHFLRKASGSN